VSLWATFVCITPHTSTPHPVSLLHARSRYDIKHDTISSSKGTQQTSVADQSRRHRRGHVHYHCARASCVMSFQSCNRHSRTCPWFYGCWPCFVRVRAHTHGARPAPHVTPHPPLACLSRLRLRDTQRVDLGTEETLQECTIYQRNNPYRSLCPQPAARIGLCTSLRPMHPNCPTCVNALTFLSRPAYPPGPW
jgi:hypothetical protein